MKLQTKIPITPSSNPFGYEDQLLLLGSCFSENIREKLSYYKFQSFVNPFGIIFHPYPITNLIQRVVDKQEFEESDIFYGNERWQSFEAHSIVAHSHKEQTLKQLNKAFKLFQEKLHKTSNIIITLGSAWGYEHKKTNVIVANCHKIPQKEFNKVLSSPKQIVKNLESILLNIAKLNPTCQVIFTVSPVRHLKDGFVKNTRSKAHLIAAVHNLVDQYESALYFPAYELVMDELRDYRFYDRDMIHPSQEAIDYIWQRFVNVYASEKAKETLKTVSSIQKGLAHKPFNAASEAYAKQQQAVQGQIAELRQTYPHIKFD